MSFWISEDTKFTKCEGIPAPFRPPTSPSSKRVTGQRAKEGVEGNKCAHAASMKIRRETTMTSACPGTMEARRVQKSPSTRLRNSTQKKRPVPFAKSFAQKKSHVYDRGQATDSQVVPQKTWKRQAVSPMWEKHSCWLGF